MIPRARADHTLYAGFWLRGLTPRHWTVTAEDVTAFTKCWGLLDQAWPVLLGQEYILGLDGSGGENTKDPRTRRVGWSLVVMLRATLEVVGGCFGGLAGLQTVPRAELQAYVMACKCTKGDIQAVTDCAYVMKGAMRHREYNHSRHIEQWREAQQCIDEREGRLTLAKAHSHLEADPELLARYNMDPQMWIVNKAADECASVAAAEALERSPPRQLVGMIDAMAWKVQERLTVIAIHAASMGTWQANMAFARKKRRNIAMQIREAANKTKHLVSVCGNRVTCRRCKSRASGEEAVALLKSECAGTPPPVNLLHPSHIMSCYRGIKFCTVCGSLETTGTSVKLRIACRDPTIAGQRNLDRLSQHRLPVGVKAWPQPDAHDIIWLDG